MTTTIKTSYRKHDWLDTKTNTPKYGIQAKAVDWEVRWLHCAEDGKPLLYDTPEERDAKLKELRRRGQGEKAPDSEPRHSPSANVSGPQGPGHQSCSQN